MTHRSPADLTTDENGYSFVETTQWWRDICWWFPCSIHLGWPGYTTASFHTTIAGRSVVIQVWKGWCPHLIPDFPESRVYFPGGIGAEVGIYSLERDQQLAGEDPPDVAGWFPIDLGRAILRWLATIKARKGTGDNWRIWWPAPNAVAADDREISFTLRHPEFAEPLISDYRTKTYWTCKWMQEASHEKWCDDHRIHTMNTTMLTEDTDPDEYILHFTVAGEEYVWEGREITHKGESVELLQFDIVGIDGLLADQWWN